MGLDLYTEIKLKLRQQNAPDLWEALAEEEQNESSFTHIEKEWTRRAEKAIDRCLKASEEIWFMMGIDVAPEDLIEQYKRTNSLEELVDLWLRDNIFNGDRSIPIEEEE